MKKVKSMSKAIGEKNPVDNVLLQIWRDNKISHIKQHLWNITHKTTQLEHELLQFDKLWHARSLKNKTRKKHL